MDKYCAMSGQLVNFHKSSFQCTKNVFPNEVNNESNSILQKNSFSRWVVIWVVPLYIAESPIF